MPSALYVALQEADWNAAFAINKAGKLTKQGEVPAPGSPSVMAVSPDRQMLYVGQRVGPAITSFRIDQRIGGLAVVRTAAQPHVPIFLAPDRTGRFMLVAYYQGGGAAVFRLAADGTVGAPSQDWLATATGAHAIATDRSNRFAYVPHIARVQDNVLEPPKNIPGPNTIMQFRFDAESGRLSPDVPSQVRQADLAGPRHYCFHPSLIRLSQTSRAPALPRTGSTHATAHSQRYKRFRRCRRGLTRAIHVRRPTRPRPAGWAIAATTASPGSASRRTRSAADCGDRGPSRQLTRAGYRYRHSKTLWQSPTDERDACPR